MRCFKLHLHVHFAALAAKRTPMIFVRREAAIPETDRRSFSQLEGLIELNEGVFG
jgi:hypothetical protein